MFTCRERLQAPAAGAAGVEQVACWRRVYVLMCGGVAIGADIEQEHGGPGGESGGQTVTHNAVCCVWHVFVLWHAGWPCTRPSVMPVMTHACELCCVSTAGVHITDRQAAGP